MGNVFHTGGKQGAEVKQTTVLSDLQKLEKELMSQRSQLTDQSEVQMIDVALEEVKAAQATVKPITEQVSSIQHGVAAYRDQPEEVEGMALKAGQKFKTYNDHIDYMKTNLNGLNTLILKK